MEAAWEDMVEVEEEAMVAVAAEAVAADMAAVMTADQIVDTIEGKIGTEDLHQSKRARKST